MGSDLSVVNAARVSFAKAHEKFDEDKDPIVFFTCRKRANAYYEGDIEVLNESG